MNAPEAAGPPPPEAPARWEERSATRVLETGRDQILERSRKIVEAAYALLARDGLDGVTIRAVLGRTGLSRRAFYERFDGKDDLMLAVFEHTIRQATRYFQAQIADIADPLARLELIVNSIVDGLGDSDGPRSQASWQRGAAMSREHLRLAETRPADLQVALTPLLDLIAGQLSQGMASGVVRSGDPESLARLVYNVVSTTAHTELMAREAHAHDPVRSAGLARELWTFCRRAIQA